MAKNTLCKLVKDSYHEKKTEKYLDLIKGAKYYCKKCGRAVKKDKNVCKPVAI